MLEPPEAWGSPGKLSCTKTKDFQADCGGPILDSGGWGKMISKQVANLSYWDLVWRGGGKLSQVVVHKDTEKTFLLKLQMPAWAGSVAEAGPLRRVLVRSHMFFLGKVALPALTDNVNESAITMRYEKDSMGQERGTHIGCTLLQKPILVQLWVVKNNESHEASTAVCHSPAKLSLVLFSSLFCLLLQVSGLYVLHL